ncbi:DUF1646 domain-containing protein [Caldibacillus lycopersici]|uniref:DUF1646 domain-containing protein n=1 Tax=Perspicuibacillus lycopersici TaxID=1325689 RepID=A0AAE3IXE2_9BACI|nr:DUF1646 domain-containing protein [Perspicuibacillus lycopersici]MCU9615139.1 DUF1646 domain-containing protein [Perspicuibacillus lycopersici]
MLGLFIILLLVLFLPFTIKFVEHNLEIFLFVMGLAAAIISGVFNRELLVQALLDPIKITVAVIIAGLLFKWFRRLLENGIRAISNMLPFRLFIALMVIVLGLVSSFITAIIAALVLVLIVSVLTLDKKSEIRLVVIACFSIGLGAALTPIGEPLSTITISKMHEDFYYLLQLVGPYIIPGVVLLGILAAILVKPERGFGLSNEDNIESYDDIFVRGIKIYFFVMGLTLLGAGFEPLINEYIIGLSSHLLYWVNILSAILDNATLAAAEISPAMSPESVKAVLLGLLVSGGMLIPGNIPNIISAGKLNITSKEWAKEGLPIGFSILIVYFIIFLFI